MWNPLEAVVTPGNSRQTLRGGGSELVVYDAPENLAKEWDNWIERAFGNQLTPESFLATRIVLKRMFDAARAAKRTVSFYYESKPQRTPSSAPKEAENGQTIRDQ
jgi:hypothetical protein